MSTHSQETISESDLTLITAVHLGHKHPAYHEDIPLQIIPSRKPFLPAATHHSPPALPLLPESRYTFTDIPIIPSVIAPLTTYHGRPVIQIQTRPVRAATYGAAQQFVLPAERLRMGEWVWIPRMGLAKVFQLRQLCGRYSVISMQIYGIPRSPMEVPLAELHTLYTIDVPSNMKDDRSP
ncbi:hypothetical protein BDN71DRAFT_1435807 [Pleurotus eryngii]|uniref:Uncharacterized protein n=1 Tax=Pleurotus eryngii TaxID=5323 RepID=A0A9P5ZK11_PLEER|nr:hypothetical protein BDN71DRAFT_1435807 [Pleurotus eryngii]